MEAIDMSLIRYLCVFLLIVTWGILSIFISTSYICNTENIYTRISRDYPQKGREPFFRHKCEYTDCSVTADRKSAPPDAFHAVVFHGPQFHPRSRLDYPAARSAGQLYVFYSMESPVIFPLEPRHDGEFNLTVTYRLDADVHLPYFVFLDGDGRTVAPAWNPLWRRPTADRRVLSKFDEIHKRKTKPVAWFVSRCSSPNRRLELVRELQKYVDVDIYGKCGPLECDNTTACFEALRRDYYFYLSFENSNCVDYVTEKLFNALSNDIIPIVFNGVDMKRFAPPHSFIDAGELSPSALGDRIKFLMNSTAEYSKYFWWRDHYRVQIKSPVSPFCSLCKILHDKRRTVKSYTRLADWLGGSPGNGLCGRRQPDPASWLQVNRNHS